MAVSCNDFWNLTYRSRLFSKDQCLKLKAECGPANTRDAKASAAWLISNGHITNFHAKTLLAGLPGPFVFDEYCVLDRLPDGDATRRLLGRHLSTRHKVILHFLADPGSVPDEHWQEICEHASLQSKVVHPHLDRCYETMTRTTHKIAITEYVKGKDASSTLAREGRFTIEDACHYARLIALGLNELHQAGLIHGRVEPKNIYLQTNGNAKLLRHPIIIPQSIDFDADDPKGRLLARADYFAPELVSPNRIPDSASDVYGLGCCLYEMLTGRPPFEGGKLDEKMVRHARESVPSLSDSIDAPNELSEIVSFMMAKNYNLRFKIWDVIHRLESFGKSGPMPRAIQRKTEAAYLRFLQQRPTAKNREAATAESELPKSDDPGSTETSDVPEPLPSTFAPSPMLRRRKAYRRSSLWLTVTGVLACVVGIGLIMMLLMNLAKKPEVTSESSVAAPSESSPISANDTKIADSSDLSEPPYAIIEDDGVALWASPTSAPAWGSRLLPDGVQFIGMIQASSLISSREGALVNRAMGEGWEAALSGWLDSVHLELDEVQTVVIGLTSADTTVPVATYIITLTEQDALESWRTRIQAERKENQTLLSVGNMHAYVPPGDSVRSFVIGQESVVQQIADSEERPAQIRRELETLLNSTDQSRHITLLSTPNFLLGDGKALLDGNRDVISRILFGLIGDDCQAISLSLHFTTNFFGELRIVTQSGSNLHQKAQAMQIALMDWPTNLIDYLGNTNVERYWQRIAVQFPLMVRFLTEQTRIEPVRGQVIANFVLPENAGHNLILAAQIALSSNRSTATEATTAPQLTIAELLQTRFEHRFGQQSLDEALSDLQDRINDQFPSVGLNIEVVGADLEQEGITRNQQIQEFSASDIMISEILTEIVRRANPVRVRSARSEEQTLVWVVQNESTIQITTRDAAAIKNLKIPSNFLR